MTTDQLDGFLRNLTSWLPVDELVGIAAELTSIPSFTGQETPLAEHIHKLLTRYGIDSFLQEVESGRFQTIGRLGPDEAVAGLLLNGHLDMDPLGRNFPGDPFIVRLDGDRLTGAGLHNMKSGDAAIIGAAIALQRSGIPMRRPLLLEFVVGELQGGKGTAFALQSGLTADVAIVPEPYSVRRVITRTAGVHKFSFVVRGITAHTSRYHEGIDAIQVMRGVLDMFEQYPIGLSSPDFPTLPRIQIASLIAGRGEGHDLSGVSYIADKATAIIDIRYPPPYEPEAVTAAIDGVIAAAQEKYPQAEISVEHPPNPLFRVGGVDMPPMDVSADSGIVRDIVGILPRVSEYSVEETGLALPFSYCGNDTTHLSRAGVECCLFGPRGDSRDTEHHVLVSEMVACARTLATVAYMRCC